MSGVTLSILGLVMARDKTKTIKERTLHIYLPTIEKVDEWKQLAKDEGTSLSKFVYEHTQDNLLQSQEGYESRVGLIDTNQKLVEENSKLHSRVEMLEVVVSRLDEEMKSYRRMPFEEDLKGSKDFDSRLMSLFKERHEIAYEELYGLLGIDPRDTKAVKGIGVELDKMMEHGIIKETRKGWRWMI